MTGHHSTRKDTAPAEAQHDTTRHRTVLAEAHDTTRNDTTRHYTVRHGTAVQSTTRERQGLLVERFDELFLHTVCPEQNDPFQSISDMGKHWTLTSRFHSLDFAGGFQVIPAESHSEKLEL